jgi:hypothetical protein
MARNKTSICMTVIILTISMGKYLIDELRYAVELTSLFAAVSL